jgi:hypothetical protein
VCAPLAKSSDRSLSAGLQPENMSPNVCKGCRRGTTAAGCAKLSVLGAALGRSALRSLFVSGLLVAALLAAGTQRALSDGEAVGKVAGICSTRVIVTFAQRQGKTPSPELVTQIAHEAGIQLGFIRAAGPGLYVFSLTAGGSDPSCRQALTRLRRNARIRSVDVDARRRALD